MINVTDCANVQEALVPVMNFFCIIPDATADHTNWGSSTLKQNVDVLEETNICWLTVRFVN